MGNVFYFSSRADLDACDNLKNFIYKCKNNLKVFGEDLNFDSWLWPKVANFTKLGVGSRSSLPEDKMAEPFISFAKAYFRYQQGHNPTGTRNESKALKVLEYVLTDIYGIPDILKLDVSALDQAAVVAREHFLPAAAYQCGRELQRLARFVTDNQFVSNNCGMWRNPIARPEGSDRTGRKAREARDKKLPSPDAVLAMADIFASVGDEPRDILISSVFALLMSGSVRISEVLELPLDCEVHDVDKYGDPAYGLRFYSGKGYGANVKWVPTVMVPVVQEAIKRVREITVEGRALALWLEKNPNLMFIHPDSAHLDRTMPLTEIDACEALGFELPSHQAKQRMYYLYGLEKGQAITLNSLWEKIKVRVPEDFPWVNRKAGITYSNALFAMQQNSLHAQRSTLRVIPWRPDVNIVNNDLSPRESLGDGLHASIFARYGFSHLDGSPMKITTHQMRHMIDTMGHRGGMSEEEIARFAGRADSKQNRVYNHVSPTEIVAKYERAIVDAGYEESTLIHCEPVDRDAYDIAPKGPVHRTLWGFCIHDYAASPCGRFRDCLNCEEHLCEKRPQTKVKLEMELADIEVQLEASERAMKDGHYGADRWYEHHKVSAARLREIISIHADKTVPDGSFIRLRQGYAPTHGSRALSARGDMVSNLLQGQTMARLSNLMEDM